MTRVQPVGIRRRGGARALWVAAAVAALVLGALPGAAHGSRPPDAAARDARPLTLSAPRAVPGALLVTAESPAAAARLVRLLPAPARRASVLAPTVVRVQVPVGGEQEAATVLSELPGVRAVEPEGTVAFAATPDDPGYPQQWAHRLARVEEAWAVSSGSAAVRVAVLDSGMQAAHPDLGANVVARVDVSTGSRRPGALDNDTCTDQRAHGHGTWVGGIVGAVGNNGQGVAGVAWQVGLVDVAIASADAGCPFPTDGAIVAGLEYARDFDGGVDVVVMSFGSPRPACPVAYQRAIDQLMAAGTLVIAAAGNAELASPGAAHVPASCNGVVSVGAVGNAEPPRRASYSSSNPYVDLVAPGGDTPCSTERCLLTTDRGGGYAAVAGTSMAAPYVGGAAALLRSARPALTPAELESVLERSARHPRGAGVRDAEYGWGLVQVGAAMALATSGQPIPAPEPDPVFPVGGGDGPTVRRIAAPGATTEPITQAVAMSQATFAAGGARHAVIARADDYADALAGSGLAHGLGPMLFNPPRGPLVPVTRAELQRVLAPGGIVYVLGGHAALDAAIDQQLEGLGYVVRRVAGRVREETAAAVADALVVLRAGLGRGAPRTVLVATRGNWPDAVTAGSLAAWDGLPVLLTAPHQLHPATADALRRLAPRELWVIGGTAVVDDTVAAAAGAAAGAPSGRLGGRTRDETAVAVAQALRARLGQVGASPAAVVTVHLDRSDGFAHALSASVRSAVDGALFVPVRRPDRDRLLDPAARLVCGLGVDGILAGGPDLLPAELGIELVGLLEGSSPRCLP